MNPEFTENLDKTSWDRLKKAAAANSSWGIGDTPQESTTYPGKWAVGLRPPNQPAVETFPFSSKENAQKAIDAILEG